MKTTTYIGLVVMLIGLAMSASAAVVEQDASAVSLTSSKGYGHVVTGIPELVGSRFDDQTAALKYGPPVFSSALFGVGSGVSSGAFVGNYLTAGVQGIQFVVNAPAGMAPVARAFLITAEGRSWVREGVQVVAGASTLNTLAFDVGPSAWYRAEDASVDLKAMWKHDLQQVAIIGVEFIQNQFVGQSATVDDFRLYGEGFMSDSAILARINRHFGVNVSSIDQLSATLKTKDSNRDGVTDLADVIAGNDFGFAAEIVEGAKAGPGITLRWPCVLGRKYTLLRAGTLFDDFLPLEGAVQMQASSSEYMEYTDTTADGSSFFYRVMETR
jgi:hypothetical protein